MAKTFNPFRTTGGTIELVRDANGNYTTKEVGFDKLSSLSLPDLGTQATTTTTQATKTASQITGQTTAAQTQSAFQAGGGGNNQPDTSGNMLQQAKQVSENLSSFSPDTASEQFSRQTSTGVTSPLDIKDPTSSVFGSTKETVSDAQKQGQGVNYSDAIMRGQVGTKFASTPKLGDSLFGFEPKGIATARGRQPTEFTKPSDRASLGFPGDSAYRGSIQSDKETVSSAQRSNQLGTLGVSGLQTVSDAQKSNQLGTTAMGVPDAIISGQQAVPEKAKKTFSESVNTALKTIKTPGMMVLDTISGAITSPQAKEQNAFNKTYFNDRGDGRIAGDPTTDVFAGMNRQSAFGNVSASAAGRIATREATIAKKGYKPGDKFYDDTQNMKNQKADYDNAKNTKAETTKTQKSQNPNLRAGADNGGTGCFIKGTLVTMADGSKKSIEKVDLGDNVAEGGKVFAAGRFLNTELYDYKGIKVSGSHMVNEDDVWMRVRDTKHGISLGDDLNTVYVFGSENRRILINDILFTDYFEVSEQNKLMDNSEDFFDNWKDYGNDVDVDNVATLNMNYEI